MATMSRPDAAALRRAYERAREELARAAPRAPGYRLFWVRGRALGWVDLPVGGAHAVLGQHAECDAVLHGDPSVSLRHLLATTVALADGPALRLLDLQTEVPFHLEDGIPRRSIVASGPVVIGLGESVIGGVPIEASPQGGLRVVAPPLSAPIVTDAAAVPRSLRPPQERGQARPGTIWPDLEDSPRSRVTSMPPSVPISELPRMQAVSHVRMGPGLAPRAPRITAPPCATLTLRRADRAASVELGEAELDLGVMIGRADRCYDAGLRSVLDTNISRSHVLLLHHGGAFEAFDLCSTQGTYANGARVRRVALPEEITLSLASVNPIQLDWRRRAVPH